MSSRQVRLEGGKKQQPAGGLSVPVCVIGGEGVEVSHLTQSALNVRHVDLNVVLKTAARGDKHIGLSYQNGSLH